LKVLIWFIFTHLYPIWSHSTSINYKRRSRGSLRHGKTRFHCWKPARMVTGVADGNDNYDNTFDLSFPFPSLSLHFLLSSFLHLIRLTLSLMSRSCRKCVLTVSRMWTPHCVLSNLNIFLLCRTDIGSMFHYIRPSGWTDCVSNVQAYIATQLFQVFQRYLKCFSTSTLFNQNSRLIVSFFKNNLAQSKIFFAQ